MLYEYECGRNERVFAQTKLILDRHQKSTMSGNYHDCKYSDQAFDPKSICIPWTEVGTELTLYGNRAREEGITLGHTHVRALGRTIKSNEYIEDTGVIKHK